MQVHFNPEATEEDFTVAIGFRKSELQFAVAVLRGIYQVVKADFVAKAIRDIEESMRPKTLALPMINYFHVCQNCFRDLDERDDNSMRISHNDDVKWKHRVCPPVKKDRPR